MVDSGPDRIADRYARLAEACSAIGREPSTIGRSELVRAVIGADRADLERRKRALEEAGRGTQAADNEMRLDPFASSLWIMGTPDEARQAITGFAQA